MKTSFSKNNYNIEYEIIDGMHILSCHRHNTTETIQCQTKFEVPVYELELNGTCYGCNKKSTGFFCRSCAKQFPELNRFRKQAVSYVACGYKNHSCDPKLKEKKKKVFQDRYGVENPSQTNEARQKLSIASRKNTRTRIAKTRKTIRERYGVDHYSQTAEYKEKYRKTSQERYGVDHVLSDDKVREKYQTTLKERYGVENPSQNKDIIAKRNQTNIERYGNICSAQSPDIKNTISSNLKELHGVESWFQVPAVIDKITHTRQLNKYGDTLETFRNDWRRIYFEKGLNAALIAFPMIKVKTAVDTFLAPEERKCADGRSHLERDVLEFFQQRGLIFEQNTRSIVPGHNRWEIDLIDRQNQISIEVNGVYWHQIINDKNDHDIKKANLMRSIGFKHLAIDESDIQNLELLTSIINPNKKRIPARKCQIFEVDAAAERQFLNDNHLDGYVASQKCWGLVFDGKLVQIMSFGKDRWSRKNQLEMIRLCSSRGVIIIGGAERLFKTQLKSSNQNIVSYSNNKFFDGSVNQRLGFEMSGVTKPGYKWMKSGVFLSRYQTQKHKLEKLLGENFDPELTEDENMQASGWHKIKDFGHTRWIYRQ